jgi:hypothetical protein
LFGQIVFIFVSNIPNTPLFLGPRLLTSLVAILAVAPGGGAVVG